MKGYYFILDSKMSRAGNVSDVGNGVAVGVETIQYRHTAVIRHLLIPIHPE